MPLIDWLKEACHSYRFDVAGILGTTGNRTTWPLTARNEAELISTLTTGHMLLPLPTESAALANVIEVSLVDYLLRCLQSVPDAQGLRGKTRGYPDLEIHGSAFGVTSRQPGGIRLARRPRARSHSSTREYIGAVQPLDRLRSGTGEFATEQEFYEYWRAYDFKETNPKRLLAAQRRTERKRMNPRLID